MKYLWYTGQKYLSITKMKVGVSIQNMSTQHCYNNLKLKLVSNVYSNEFQVDKLKMNDCFVSREPSEAFSLTVQRER